ncbi:MAG: AAA family ATPase [Desulfobacterales bacterium]|nr:AAA family ATPase [Desulfobacterales bacterium]
MLGISKMLAGRQGELSKKDGLLIIINFIRIYFNRLLSKFKGHKMGSFIKSVLKIITKENVGKTAIATGGLLVKKILKRPAIQAYLEYQIKKLLYGWSEDNYCPEDILISVEKIVNVFKSSEVHPNKIAIDGVPGSGKSSLAKALAKKLDMDVQCLDHWNMDEKILFDKDRTIYEHHRLLRTQEIDNFDVIIYIDEPVEISKKKIMLRKRGAYLIDIMDYEKLKKIGLKAYFSADGKSIDVDESFIKLKIKPKEGFNDIENIHNELRNMGFTGDILDKEEALFLVVYGKANKGFSAYINPWTYKDEIIQTLLATLNFKKTKKGRREFNKR